MLSVDILKSFDRLKSGRLVNHMQNETIIDIHDVHYDEKVEIDIIIF
jgi:hypothetical protein